MLYLQAKFQELPTLQNISNNSRLVSFIFVLFSLGRSQAKVLVLTLIYPASENGPYTRGGGAKHHPLEIGLEVPRDLKFLKVISEDTKVRLACNKSGLY